MSIFAKLTENSNFGENSWIFAQNLKFYSENLCLKSFKVLKLIKIQKYLLTKKFEICLWLIKEDKFVVVFEKVKVFKEFKHYRN